MKKIGQRWFSWRLKLILLLGCLGGLGLGISGHYVSSITDDPLGPTPLSWTFKPNSARVATAFEVDSGMQKQDLKLPPPVIDQVLPERTELALFALG